MKRELIEKIKILEQKMSKSPNNGGSRFLYKWENDKIPTFNKELTSKATGKTFENNLKLSFKINHRGKIQPRVWNFYY